MAKTKDSDEEKELKPLSDKHQKVIDEYLQCWVKWRAYKKIYPKATEESARSAAHVLFTNHNFSAHLQARLDEAQLSAEEALKINADIAHGDLGVFFKVVDEWMFYPLPEYEILDEKEVVDETKDPPEKRISYRVRHIALDVDRIKDPRYSHLLKEFSNSRRRGYSIKLHDKSAAVDRSLRVHGKYKDLGTETNPIVVRTIEVLKSK